METWALSVWVVWFVGKTEGCWRQYWRIDFGAWNKTVPHFTSDGQNRCGLYLVFQPVFLHSCGLPTRRCWKLRRCCGTLRNWKQNQRRQTHSGNISPVGWERTLCRKPSTSWVPYSHIYSLLLTTIPFPSSTALTRMINCLPLSLTLKNVGEIDY